MRSRNLISLSLCLLFPSFVTGRYRVENLSRDGEHLREGDLLEVSCQSCLEKGEAVTSWDIGDGIEIDSVVSDFRVKIRLRAVGIVRLEARTNGDTVRHSPLLFHVKDVTVFCHVWRHCFTLVASGQSPSEEVECVSSFSPENYSQPLFVRLWVGLSSNPYNRSSAYFHQLEEETTLTTEVYNLGENPRVSILKEALMSRVEPVVSFRSNSGEFNQNGSSFWEFEVGIRNPPSDFAGGSVAISIAGQAVASMGCASEQRTIWLSLPKYQVEQMPALSANLSMSSLLAIDACSGAFVFQNRMEPTIQVVQDLFSVDANIGRVSANSEFLDVTTSRQGLIALSRDGIHMLRAALDSRDHQHTFEIAFDSPDASATAISSPYGCDWLLDFSNRTRNDIIAVWNANTSNVDKFYLGSSTDGSFNVFSLEREYRLVQVLPLVSMQATIVLAKRNHTSFDVLFVQEQTFQVNLAATFSDVGSNPRISSPVTPSGHLLLFGGPSVYFSQTAGRSWQKLHFRQYNMTTLTYETLMSVVEIVESRFSTQGEFILRTSMGRLFKGKVGLVDVYEILSPFPETSDAAILVLFRPDGTLLGIEAAEDVQVFQILSETPSTKICPYLTWDRRIPTDFDSFYLDMNENMSMTLSLSHHRTNEGMFVSYEISDRRLLEMEVGKEFVETSPSGDLIRRIRDVHLTVPKRISSSTGVGEQHLASGKVIVRGIPSHFENGCNNHLQLVQVQVGCPRGRHLRYRSPKGFEYPSNAVVTSSCDNEASAKPDPEARNEVRKACTCRRYAQRMRMSFGSNIADFERMRQHALSSGSEIEFRGDTAKYWYDYEQFGCPTFIPYTHPFVPRLEVWDGDHFVREVDGDYVLLEVNGRKDFSYGLTASQVGCRREPDTWEAKLAPDVNFTDAWSFLNQRSCFFKAEENEDKDDWEDWPYEVLNKSSPNFVSFKATRVRERPFQFVAVVIDPDFSFCHLHTSFSVEAYGIPMDGFTTFLIILVVVLCSMLMLFCTYLIHRDTILAASLDAETKKNL